MAKPIEKWWNEASKNYQKDANIHTRSAHYGPLAPDENKLKLLGNVKGKKILEIGCGGAQCSIAFAKKGAICTGIDLSEQQLKHAKKLIEKNKVKVKLLKGDIQTLKGIKSNSYDIVFTAFALQYIADLTKCFKQVYRVLKKKGLFVLSLDHPFYEILSQETHKVKESYFKTGKMIEQDIWANGSKHKFVFYKRKVSDIHNSLTETGFFVEKIIEPLDLKNKSWQDEKGKKFYPKGLARLIGPTIIFKARKTYST